MDLLPPIAYLEKSDFTASGDLDPKLARKPVFIMLQAGYCGHCTTAKPAFQALANSGTVNCMTIQIDGQRPSEKALSSMLDSICPGFRGFPSYVLYNHGKKIPYNGNRSTADMKQFVLEHI